MKLWKILTPIAICLVLALLLLPTTAEAATIASGTCGDNLTWTLDDAGTLTISGTGAMYDYDWDAVPWYSNGASVKKGVITDGVTTISNYAFSCCSGLTGVTIPDSVTTIGDEAFSTCTSLTGVTIPGSVTAIGDSAFSECYNLTGIWVDANNPNYSSDSKGVLFNKDKTTLIQAPGAISGNYTIPDSVITIGDSAFYDSNHLIGVTIGNSVTTIGRSAFTGSSLTSVTIPDSVTTIGFGAFFDCRSLTDVYYGGTQAQWNAISVDAWNGELLDAALHCMVATGTCGDNLTWTLDDAGTLTISGTGAMTDYDYESRAPWYSSRYHIKEVVIADGVTTIGSSAFANCLLIANVTIPDSVTAIGEEAFSACYELTAVTIPDSVTAIGNSAFTGCEALTNVTIPGSVTTIASFAFSWCSSLKSVTIPEGMTAIGDSAFRSCRSLTTVTIPDSVTTIGFFAFFDCASLTDVYYGGSQAQWGRIFIDIENEDLRNAKIHFAVQAIPGDVDGNAALDTNDAVYLLLSVMFGTEDYPAPDGMSLDLNADGAVDTNDAVYLLLHVMFGPEDYPI